MILKRISPRKLWSVLDITVCNNYKILEALPGKAIKMNPRIVECGLDLHSASGTSRPKFTLNHLFPLTQQQRTDLL